ncbi:MAG: serine/threonine protein kinase, bacterial [Blastocatellia bacterium]|jgi:formylglycine-generating enzyme required for sulfatase activity|nr:serine/threonine protein kinase, bacterial [Blastocatellia bacterium]
MSNDPPNDLAFYCPQHQLRFRATGDEVVTCERGGHSVGHGFPEKSWWEYCCDCATFWPSQLGNGYLRRSECLVCDRPTAKRYVCEVCQVVSIESAALVKRKLYSITIENGIFPNCPGCAKRADSVPSEHQCGEIAASIFTSRSACPFCETAIRAAAAPSLKPQPPQVCPFCGTRGTAGIKFCSRCGKPQQQTSQDDATNEVDDSPTDTPTNQWNTLVLPGSQRKITTEPELLSNQIIRDLREAPSSGVEDPKDLEIDPTSNEIPPWQSTLPAFPPKRRVRWKPAAIAVAITAVVVLTIAIILTANRSGSKSSLPNSPPTPPPGMVYVLGSEFTMGNDLGDEFEKPAHQVTLKAFFIDKNEVTCSEYEKFIKATNHRPPNNWSSAACPATGINNPVTGVDWYDATAYAQWTGKRLPTEEEWELAARGTDKRIYPWGNDWRANAANAGAGKQGGVVDVGSYPAGKSPSGALDMIGNAWEWTSSDFKAYPGGHISDKPSGELKVIRGGYWGSSAPKATTTFRRGWDARDAQLGYKNTGFRCAKDS